MKKKIKHAFAYVLLVSWTGIIIYGFASFLWDWVVKPAIELGIVKSLAILLFSIGLLTVIWIIFLALEKLIDWLLEE